MDIPKVGDIYGISNKFVKLSRPSLTHILVLLFNISITEGIFPDALKNVKVIPIHKGDSIFETSNYRPISLLLVFSKILEKLMYAQTIEFISQHYLWESIWIPIKQIHWTCSQNKYTEQMNIANSLKIQNKLIVYF